MPGGGREGGEGGGGGALTVAAARNVFFFSSAKCLECCECVFNTKYSLSTLIYPPIWTYYVTNVTICFKSPIINKKDKQTN